jgi:hypothetical protein
MSHPQGVPDIIVEAAETHYRVTAEMRAASDAVAETLQKHKQMLALHRERRQSDIGKSTRMRKGKLDRQAGRRMRASTGSSVWQDPSTGLDSLNVQLGASGADPRKALKMLHDPAGLHVSRYAAMLVLHVLPAGLAWCCAPSSGDLTTLTGLPVRSCRCCICAGCTRRCHYWLLTHVRHAGQKEQESITQTLGAAREKFDELDTDSSGYLDGKIAPARMCSCVTHLDVRVICLPTRHRVCRVQAFDKARRLNLPSF